MRKREKATRSTTTYNAVVERIGDLQHLAKLLGLSTDHNVLDLNAFDGAFLEAHDGTSHHAGKDGGRKVGAGKAALDKAGGKGEEEEEEEREKKRESKKET